MAGIRLSWGKSFGIFLHEEIPAGSFQGNPVKGRFDLRKRQNFRNERNFSEKEGFLFPYMVDESFVEKNFMNEISPSFGGLQVV